jgi:hypothetical protein
MNAETSEARGAPPAGPSRSRRALIVVRRVHMYLGLFLGPWMAMYALSTLAMTHREFVRSLYPTETPVLVTERELDYTRAFPPGTTREEMGRLILQDLGLEGSHRVSGGRGGEPLVVYRQHAWTNRRITFDAGTGKLLLQREEFRGSTFLERMHRRRGYDRPYAVDDLWGISVDLAVVAMVLWCLSSILIWWELGPTRRWGTLALASGVALFAAFLVLL